MRLLVVGAGAVGSWLGGTAAAGGADVTFAEPGPRREAIARDGMCLVGPNGTRRLRPRVVPSVAEAFADGRYDVVLVAVKAYHTRSVARELAGAIGVADLQGGPAIASFQNGIGNDAVLASALPAARQIAATLTTGLQLDPSGTVRASHKGGVGLTSAKAASDLACALSSGGIAVRRYDDPDAMKWSKMLLNLLGSATCAALGRPPDTVFADRRLFELERAAWSEALAVVRARGISPVDLPGYPVRLLVPALSRLPGWLAHRVLGGPLAGARGDRLPSVAADLAAGRSQTENEVLTGAVAAHGEAHGVPVPVSRALSDIVDGIAAGRLPRARFAGNPDALLAAMHGSWR